MTEPQRLSRHQPTMVIRVKITPPPVPAEVVVRPRLEAQLADLIERHRAVRIYATAGAGKTTAVRQATERIDRPLAWLSVDSTDTAPGRLLTYLEAALAPHVSAAVGVVSGALAMQLPHAEVAGLLADSIGEIPVLLVLDDLERLVDSADALTVLDAFLRYTPSTARIVLVSRTELPVTTSGAATPWQVGLGESDLAFTVEEAAQALTLTGRADIDPEEAVTVTGGWVTGVLFEAWRAAGVTTGLGGEADPLFGYLSVQILANLDPDEREFLISTSVLDEVTSEDARSLGAAGAAGYLHTLRSKHLPAQWDTAGTALRCHPRFREYLLARLRRRTDPEVQPLYEAHARLLISRGHLEDAVEQLLAAGAPEEAVQLAEQVLETVIERGDLAVAHRWLEQVEPVRRSHHTGLAGAELMLALATDDYDRGMRIADRLAADGHREEMARSSSKLASMMAWAYLHTGRPEEMHAVLDVGKPGAELDAMRYCLTLLLDPASAHVHDIVGRLHGDPLDAAVMRVHYYRGRLPLLTQTPASPWAAKAAKSWQLGALLMTGHIDQAAELYQQICRHQDPGVWLASSFQVRLLCALDDRDGAWRALLKGRDRIRASGSVMLGMLSYVDEAELELRFNHDAVSAKDALEQVRRNPIGRSYRFITEQADTWLGLALLLEGDNATAAQCLRRTVASMHRNDSILLLPAAATYLAEAEWRLGNATAADHASDLALTAAEQQRSNHTLLNAMSDFPAVLSRRLDAEPTSESPWHELGRALTTRGTQLAHPIGAAINLAEFGRVAISVNGRETDTPRIKKSYEVLSFLAGRPSREAAKDDILGALFGDHHDESSAAYLRQAIRQLRQVLPETVTIEVSEGRVRLAGNSTITSDSEHFRSLVAQAANMRGANRLATLLDALELTRRGDFLPGMSSPWAEEQRLHISTMAIDVSMSAAEVAFAQGDLRQAAALVEFVLTQDPYREGAWRLAMRLADANGDPDGVLAAYRSCRSALAELATEPCSTTLRLLDDLRR
ncbi:hypothetical protein MPY17_39630 (plasmid) [Rhodococcus opacus]|uniref:BTAD domain-containing putative transcriptional regulator n=1 Tax=Rhodococcus opacus TaxID=37919 RepID=UPI001FF548B1|nr:BTAD domain-containing putative transcriptional regulator [Rhodococcus opacus]UOT08509.1 hypothetical protein MPY17_39630 [Rhodococcus opacus]